MKFEKYEKPELEELDILLEGSFLDEISDPENPDVSVGEGTGGGNDDGDDSFWD